jgi:hypothetical protein
MQSHTSLQCSSAAATDNIAASIYCSSRLHYGIHLLQSQVPLRHPSAAASRFIASIYFSLKAMLQCPSTAASSIIAAPINFSLKASLQHPSTAVSRHHSLLQCQGNIAASIYFSLEATLLRPSTAASRHHCSIHQLQPQGIFTIHYTIFSASKQYYSVNLLQHRAAGRIIKASITATSRQCCSFHL